MTIGVVVNPVAGGGRAAEVWPAVKARLEATLGPVTALTTTRPGEGEDLAQQLIREGADLIVAVGGDGTANEVVDGILRSGRLPQLGVVPIGTGTDFVRTLGLPHGEDAAIAAIGSGKTRLIDAGRLSFLADDGTPTVRHFLNVASVGISGPIVRAVNRAKAGRQVSGKSIFYWHTLLGLFRYKPVPVRVVLDGGEAIESRIAIVAVANGRYFGGGMMIAPDAELDDGLFDVVVYRGTSRIGMLLDFRLIYTGAHRDLPTVTIRRVRRVEVTPLDGPMLLDVDGESPGSAPASFDILPKAVNLRVAG